MRTDWETATRARIRRGDASALDEATLALLEYERKVAEALTMDEEKIAAASVDDLLNCFAVEQEWLDTGLNPAKEGKTPLVLKVKKLAPLRAKVRKLQEEAEERLRRKP